VYEHVSSWSLAKLNGNVADFSGKTPVKGNNVLTRKKIKLRESSCLPGKCEDL
jgi:hypothetical protein